MGVHWSGAGRGRVKSNFREVIKGFIGGDEDDEGGGMIDKFMGALRILLYRRFTRIKPLPKANVIYISPQPVVKNGGN